jgi:Predicted permease, DMT superfamily
MVINSSIMASITPLLIIFFSWLIFKTQTYFMQFFGIILSIIGVLLIISKANFTNLINLNFTTGDLWMIAAVFSWGLYSVLLKKIDNTLSQLATLEVMIFVGLIFIFPFYIFESFNNSYLPKDFNEVLMIGYVAIFASITSFFAWNKGVAILGANKASLFLHLIPVFSSMWAIIFLGEKFSFFHLLGTAFIIFGIILSNRN